MTLPKSAIGLQDRFNWVQGTTKYLKYSILHINLLIQLKVVISTALLLKYTCIT